MKKMKLSMDELHVESFSIEAASAEAGTVKANEYTGKVFTCDPSCDPSCRTMACPCLVSEYFTQCIC